MISLHVRFQSPRCDRRQLTDHNLEITTSCRSFVRSSCCIMLCERLLEACFMRHSSAQHVHKFDVSPGTMVRCAFISRMRIEVAVKYTLDRCTQNQLSSMAMLSGAQPCLRQKPEREFVPAIGRQLSGSGIDQQLSKEPSDAQRTDPDDTVTPLAASRHLSALDTLPLGRILPMKLFESSDIRHPAGIQQSRTPSRTPRRTACGACQAWPCAWRPCKEGKSMI